MQLTLFTDYAIRTLVYLAQQPTNHLVTVEMAATELDIPRNHLMKITARLSNEGYLSTVRGQRGGMRLKTSPSKFSSGSLFIVQRITTTFSI